MPLMRWLLTVFSQCSFMVPLASLSILKNTCQRIYDRRIGLHIQSRIIERRNLGTKISPARPNFLFSIRLNLCLHWNTEFTRCRSLPISFCSSTSDTEMDLSSLLLPFYICLFLGLSKGKYTPLVETFWQFHSHKKLYINLAIELIYIYKQSHSFSCSLIPEYVTLRHHSRSFQILSPSQIPGCRQKNSTTQIPNYFLKMTKLAEGTWTKE